MNGSVDPNGCETTYTFEYGAGNYLSQYKGTAGNGTSPVSVSGTDLNLQAETKYQFRLKATNSKGSATGGTLYFTTGTEPPPPPKPTVTTQAATGMTINGATLNGTVNPNGYSTTYKFEYGTKEKELNKATAVFGPLSGSSTQKVQAAVSLEPGTKYYFRIWANNSGGTSTGGELNFTTPAILWQTKSTPNPAGASDSNLYDVSCEPSTSVCTAVGKSTISGADNPVAQRWNGTSWSEQAPAKKSGATHTRLFGVDCPSEIRCLAVGNHQSAGTPSLLSEIWNEGKWNVQTTPLPAEATSSEFVAIGCNSTASCTAVGSAVIGEKKTAIAERWASPTWALSSIPIPAGAKSSQLDGVDCLWSNFCVAVGRYTNSEGLVKNLAVFWNGTSWSLQTLTDPEGAFQTNLLDVSCTATPNVCTAVGSWKDFTGEFPEITLVERTLAYRFTGGSTWTLQSTPDPSGSNANVFHGVSCATETSCTATGSWLSGESSRPLAAVWNGSSWSIQGTTHPAGANSSSFSGVSCLGSSCFGVGWSTNFSGTDTTLAEFRE